MSAAERRRMGAPGALADVVEYAASLKSTLTQARASSIKSSDTVSTYCAFLVSRSTEEGWSQRTQPCIFPPFNSAEKPFFLAKRPLVVMGRTTGTPVRPLNFSVVRTRQGRRPCCSCPRDGSKSTQKISPRPAECFTKAHALWKPVLSRPSPPVPAESHLSGGRQGSIFFARNGA